MNRTVIVSRIVSIASIAVLAVATLTSTQALAAPADGRAEAIVVAQAGGTEPRELEPRYKPVPPQPESAYNDAYIFALTRGVADSTLHPAAKVTLFPVTVVLDLVYLPFATIAGFFG
jgi:hypothetical protein